MMKPSVSGATKKQPTVDVGLPAVSNTHSYLKLVLLYFCKNILYYVRNDIMKNPYVSLTYIKSSAEHRSRQNSPDRSSVSRQYRLMAGWSW